MALLTNLISFWEHQEATGNNRLDSTATANTLTQNGIVTVSGKVGNASNFVPASSSELRRSTNASLETNTASAHTVDWTWNTWCRLTDEPAVQYVFISKGDGSVGYEYIVYYVGGLTDRFIALIGTTAVYDIVTADTFGAAPNIGTDWYMVTATFNAATSDLSIGINAGTMDVNANVTNFPSALTADFTLGRYSAIAILNGDMDQTGFWKRVLTGTEITQLYNAGAGMSYAAMVAADAVVGFRGQGQLVSSKRGQLAVHP